MTPPKEWPDIIKAQSFMQVDRDEDVEFMVDTPCAARVLTHGQPNSLENKG
tara:strand:+ start:408 stop:560 length:153 start_codon:yes stop_codon:yes gene_type:complete